MHHGSPRDELKEALPAVLKAGCPVDVPVVASKEPLPPSAASPSFPSRMETGGDVCRLALRGWKEGRVESREKRGGDKENCLLEEGAWLLVTAHVCVCVCGRVVRQNSLCALNTCEWKKTGEPVTIPCASGTVWGEGLAGTRGQGSPEHQSTVALGVGFGKF